MKNKSSSGRIKTLLLRRKNDWYGTCFGMPRQPLRLAAVAAAIDEKRRCNKKYRIIFFYCGKNDYCGAAAIEKKDIPLLLRRSSLAAPWAQ